MNNTTDSEHTDNLPAKPRKGEVIGGGFLIFRRGKRTGRVGVKMKSLPFEHGSLESAQTEVERLTKANPGERFVIFQQITE